MREILLTIVSHYFNDFMVLPTVDGQLSFFSLLNIGLIMLKTRTTIIYYYQNLSLDQ